MSVVDLKNHSAAAFAYRGPLLLQISCSASICGLTNLMARITIILIATVAAYLATCQASDVARSGGRALMATSGQLTAQGCAWSGSMCELNPEFALTLTAADDKAKLAKKIAAMEYKCSAHNTSDACGSDTANGCSWHGYNQECKVGEEWTAILACPGTKAADTLKCTAAEAKADCDKIATCQWKVPTAQDLASITEQVTSLANSIKDAVTSKGGDASTSGNSREIRSPISDDGACLPDSVSVVDFAKGALAMMTTAITGTGATYTEADWGTCAGVQLLKAKDAACKGTTEALCKAGSAACLWSAEDGQCKFGDGLIYLLTAGDSQGDFDKGMEKVVAACAAAGANETACTQAGDANKGTFTEAAVTDSLAYTQPAASDADVVSRAFALVVAPLVAAAMMLMA